jgi:hypothetical protein
MPILISDESDICWLISELLKDEGYIDLDHILVLVQQ